MGDFEYQKMLEQIRNERDLKQRDELFSFIGDNGDDRFIEPLTELMDTDDSPNMRHSLYTTFASIGSELAEQVIQNKVRSNLPKDDGMTIAAADWTKAVEFMINSLDTKFIDKVKNIIKSDGILWGNTNKGGVGVYIRNLLRNNGFDWGENALETYWPWVVEDALKKLEEK